MDTHQTIRTLLAKNGGQTKKAEQAVRQLAERDPAFLLQLVTPHLAGIVSHAIARAQKTPATRDAPEQKNIVKSAPAKNPTPVGLNAVLDKLARNINADGKPKSVSQQHKDALHTLAKKK